MSDAKQAAQGSAATADPSLPYAQMSKGQKIVFIGKLVISILSFGFIFPNLTGD